MCCFVCFLDQEQLLFLTQILNHEQRNLCVETANLSLSATRLFHMLMVFKRYFIALTRAPHVPENDTANASKKISTTTELTPTAKTISKQNTDPVVGLARVGSRAALNFSFAFLKRAWRSGEDTDLCGELLVEALEALQLLAPAALFDDSNVSPVWLEVVERSSKFLRQVVTG